MINLEKLSLRELEALLKAAEHRKATLASRRSRAAVRKDLIGLAAGEGYTIAELFDDRPPPWGASRPVRAGSGAKVAAKYRDPANKRNTWSGRGRMPRWLAEKVRLGEQVADYLIPGLARPRPKNVGSIGRRSLYKAG